jgi:YD repeat-containing protein
MKTNLLLSLIGFGCLAVSGHAQNFPLNTSNTSNTWGAALFSSGTLSAPQEAEQPSATPMAFPAPFQAFSAGSTSLFAADFSTYPQIIQNLVRATDGDARKLFDLIHNHIEFQPYFGFRKSPESTWFSRSGNDADQAYLLVECLRAAGFDADFEYGVMILTEQEMIDWFDADNASGLSFLVGSSGYFAGSVGSGLFAIEQIWCTVLIDNVRHSLAPGYKTFQEVAGIDLGAAMNYSRLNLLTTAGGTETATYAQSISESATMSALQTMATTLVQELQTNHPTASMEEIVSGRKIQPKALASDYSNGFYPGAFLHTSFDNFIFEDPYGEHLENGTTYSFYAELTYAVGLTNAAGDAFTSTFFEETRPTGQFSGKKVAIIFDETNQDRAQLWIEDVLVAEESLPVNSGSIGLGYTITYPYDRGLGTAADEIRVRPISRGNSYVYAYNFGNAGLEGIQQQRRLKMDAYNRQGLLDTDPKVVTEALYLLALKYFSQEDLASEMIGKHRNFTPILQHSMTRVQQEASVGVDIIQRITAVPNDGNLAKLQGNNIALSMIGSAMEHGVIEQNFPERTAVSTIRYLRENNLAGGKTFYVTSANYSSIQSDSDFQNGWTTQFRSTVFPANLSAGFQLIIPEDGAITIDDLTGNGYFVFNNDQVGAVINPGPLKGGFSTEEFFVQLDDIVVTDDATPGPDNVTNPVSYDPIDMLSGAYIYDHSDLNLSGTDVRGLNFTRHYTSIASGRNTGLGKGWRHGYESSILERSNPGTALGTATPVHASSLLVATWVMSDLVDLPTSPKAWVVNAISAYWGLEEILQNTATVTLGQNSTPFTKLADGSFVPPPGMTSQLTQDSGTSLYSLEERFDFVADFNADNQLSTLTDTDGKQKIFSYVTSGDAIGKTSIVTDAYGRTLTFTYTGSLLTKITDSTGREVNFGYTGDLLTSVTDPEGDSVSYTYNAEDRMETSRNEKNELVAQNTYDALGQVYIQVAEGDVAQEWEYAFTGVLNVEINPDGEFLSYVFNSKGLTSEIINGESEKILLEYDGQNQLIQETDPRGNITRFEYDSQNNLRFTYDARNGASGTTYKIENQYYPSNLLHKTIDQEGNETVFFYTAENHLEKIVDPQLRETVFAYFSSGPHDGLLQTTTAPGNTSGQVLVTSMTYDSNGYPNTITRPDGSVVSQTFNSRGDMLLSEVTTTGETNTYPVTRTYDLNRRLLTTEDSLGFGEILNYNAVGNLDMKTDRFGNTSSWTFSPMNRMETSTGSNNETANYFYDDSGRSSLVVDPLSQTTSFTYDLAGRLETSANALSETVTYGYDEAGNQNSITNARSKAYPITYTANNLQATLTTPLGRVFTYTYDDRLLPKTIVEPSAQTTTFYYFDDGLLKQSVDPTGTIDLAYDAKGRLSTVTEGANTITRTYDELDRIATFTDSPGNALGYAFDGGGNLTTLTYPGSLGSVSYTYDDAGRLSTVTDWASRLTEFIYDTNSRLAEIRYPNGTVCEFEYDSVGRRIRQTDTHTATETVLLDQRFTYDVLNRFTGEVITPDPSMYAIPATTMTYNDDDQIASWQSGATALNPVFDLDGNMTSGPLEGVSGTFVYDSRNRLTQAGSAVYVYDAEDRRISKTESGVTTTFVHDPHAPLSQLLQATTFGSTTNYVYAGGKLLYEETKGQITVYHFDSRGSTRAVSNSSGTVINRFTYSVYGELVSASSTPETPFLFRACPSGSITLIHNCL